MVTIRRVSGTAFDAPEVKPKALSARELRRMALERSLTRAIRGAAQDGARVAFRLVLEKEDKVSTIQAAFRRVKAIEKAADVNLLTVGGVMYIARRPQRRGRRPSAAA